MNSAKEKGSTQVILIREILLLFSLTTFILTEVLFFATGLSFMVLLGGGLAIVLFVASRLLIPFDKSKSRIGDNLSHTGIWGFCILVANGCLAWIKEPCIALWSITLACLMLLYALLDDKRRE
jgi:hypothetical protein